MISTSVAGLPSRASTHARAGRFRGPSQAFHASFILGFWSMSAR